MNTDSDDNIIASLSGIAQASKMFGFLINQTQEQLGLIVGPPGTGKTTAAKYLAAKFGGVYVSCRPALTPFQLAKHLICCITGYEVKVRSLNEAISLLVTELKGCRRPVFLDEADFIVEQRKLLEVVRVVHDESQCPFILIGIDIVPQLKGFRLFIDRVQYECSFHGCSFEDVCAIASKRYVKIDEAILKKIHSRFNGNLRQIQRALSHLELEALRLGTREITEWDEEVLPEFAMRRAA